MESMHDRRMLKALEGINSSLAKIAKSLERIEHSDTFIVSHGEPICSGLDGEKELENRVHKN